jgi:hypothetical protein
MAPERQPAAVWMAVWGTPALRLSTAQPRRQAWAEGAPSRSSTSRMPSLVNGPLVPIHGGPDELLFGRLHPATGVGEVTRPIDSYGQTRNGSRCIPPGAPRT